MCMSVFMYSSTYKEKSHNVLHFGKGLKTGVDLEGNGVIMFEPQV